MPGDNAGGREGSRLCHECHPQGQPEMDCRRKQPGTEASLSPKLPCRTSTTTLLKRTDLRGTKGVPSSPPPPGKTSQKPNEDSNSPAQGSIFQWAVESAKGSPSVDEDTDTQSWGLSHPAMGGRTAPVPFPNSRVVTPRRQVCEGGDSSLSSQTLEQPRRLECTLRRDNREDYCPHVS